MRLILPPHLRPAATVYTAPIYSGTGTINDPRRVVAHVVIHPDGRVELPEQLAGMSQDQVEALAAPFAGAP